MAREKNYEPVGPSLFTADGGADGLVRIADTADYKVKREVIISANTLPNLVLEVKRVIDKTTLYVGLKDKGLKDRKDISLYTVALNAKIQSSGDEKRPNIPTADILRSVFSEEPTLAFRSLLVDKYGFAYTTQNPFPVRLSDGSVNIGTVNAELEVQLSHLDNFPNIGDVADSVRVGDGEDILEINPDGSINVVSNGKKNVSITNISFPTANTEQAIVIPQNTKEFTLTVRDGNAKAKISYSIGDSGTVYKTIPYGCNYWITNLDLDSNLTLYMQINKPNQEVELEIWT